MNFIELDDVEWKKVRYLKLPLTADDEQAKWLYTLELNEPLASWDVFSYWEVERILSMREELKKGDIFFDIGTEQGWCNLVYAQIVGAGNMVLIEPTKEFWPNIKALWNKNTDVPPLACYSGLFSNRTTSQDVLPMHQFPDEADAPLIDRNKYQYLHEDHKGISEITLDDYVRLSGIVPDVLNIDVEGAELRVFEGARLTLEQYKPKIYVSIHDDLGRRDYDTTPEDTIEFLSKFGYEGEWLGTNHEAHWYFR